MTIDDVSATLSLEELAEANAALTAIAACLASLSESQRRAVDRLLDEVESDEDVDGFASRRRWPHLAALEIQIRVIGAQMDSLNASANARPLAGGSAIERNLGRASDSVSGMGQVFP